MDGAGHRQDHYMPGSPCFQGAGARPRRGAGGVHVVHEKDFGRGQKRGRYDEGVPHVLLALRLSQSGLWAFPPGSPEDERRERPTG